MEPGKFGFCIHPITYKDITRKFQVLEKMPSQLVSHAMKWIPPFKASQITGVVSEHGEASGWFIAIPLVSHQIMNLPVNFVTKKIIKAGKIAESMGAQILGLGALTAVIGDKGETIRKNLNIAVTTGNSYTVATAIDAVKNACVMMEKNIKACNAVVVGATGSIGRICALMLAEEVDTITLVSKNDRKLESVANEILQTVHKNPRIERNIQKALQQADIVITVSSSVDAIILPEYLKVGAIVCDVARPRDVSKEVYHKRKDVLVIEGGVVEVPGDVNFGLNFGFPSKLCYACMAETMILALENRYEDYSIGQKLSLEKVLQIKKMAQKHGFRLAGFRSFERVIDDEYFCEIKENIRKVLSSSN